MIEIITNYTFEVVGSAIGLASLLLAAWVLLRQLKTEKSQPNQNDYFELEKLVTSIFSDIDRIVEQNGHSNPNLIEPLNDSMWQVRAVLQRLIERNGESSLLGTLSNEFYVEFRRQINSQTFNYEQLKPKLEKIESAV